jgi:hypothetical protein
MTMVEREELDHVATSGLGEDLDLIEQSATDPVLSPCFVDNDVLDDCPRTSPMGQVRYDHQVCGADNLIVDGRHQQRTARFSHDGVNEFRHYRQIWRVRGMELGEQAGQSLSVRPMDGSDTEAVLIADSGHEKPKCIFIR